MLDVEFVVTIHDEIIRDLGGLPGFAGGGLEGVASALGRIEQHAYYAGLDDVFGIAGMYALAIAQGHVFNDANKRTALACALAYLREQGIDIPKRPELEDLTVDLAQGHLTSEEFGLALSIFADLNGSAGQ